MSPLFRALPILAIGAAVVLPGYAAYVGSYVSIVICLVALLAGGWRQHDVWRQPSTLSIVGAIALIAVTLPFVFQGQQDLVGPVILLPMLCAPALAILAAQTRWTPAPAVFSGLALAGAALACAGGAYQYYILSIDRPGLGNNPIHFGTLAVMAGGLALVGVASGASRWRYLFLLGPVLGVGAAMISGSRGPLLGAAVMTAASVPFLFRWFWREPLFRLAMAVTLVLGASALAWLLANGNSRALGLFDSALNVFRFTGGTDDIRVALYTSAIHAFAQSPFYGHGIGQLMEAARSMFPEQGEVHSLENLHADWANFAVMAGIAGLLSYAFLLIAPLLLLFDARVRRDRTVLLGTVMLVAGQIALGASNSMFGILPQTVIYAVALGYFMSRAQEIRRRN